MRANNIAIESGRRERRSLYVRACVALVILLAYSATAFAQATSNHEISPDTAVRLRGQIASSSVESKRSALFEIRNIRSESASRLALPALRDKDPIVRGTAAASIVFLPKTEASQALLPLLNDRQEFVRREAAYALGDVQDFATTAPLIRLMQDDKILEVKTSAAVALGKIGDMSAIPNLLDVLRSRPRPADEFLRRSAARSVGQIAQINVTGDPSVLTPQNFLPDKFKDLGSSGPTGPVPSPLVAAVDVLTAVLQNKSESDDARREAAYALGAIGDTRSVPVLQTYVSSPDPYLAEISREALLKIERRNNRTSRDLNS